MEMDPLLGELSLDVAIFNLFGGMRDLSSDESESESEPEPPSKAETVDPLGFVRRARPLLTTCASPGLFSI